MDPALQEELRPNLDPNERIEAIIRLAAPFQYPDKVQVVAQFGDVVTVRVRRGDVQEVYDNPAVRSFKAKRIIGKLKRSAQGAWNMARDAASAGPEPTAPAIAGATGKGVVLAVLDWGADFLHRDFIDPAGKTRFLAIWDQSKDGQGQNKYGYGSIHTREAIDHAIQTQEPYAALGYKPGDGSHGTLVAGIAAGSGHAGPKGIAPEADLVFVHLAANERVLNPRLDLGDSLRLLEALDFVRSVAADRPLAINMSLGAHGGSHDGLSLVEIAIDNFLAARSNTMICQSVGNYFNNQTHHHGRLKPGRRNSFRFRINEKDKANNELELWYSGRDEFLLQVNHPASGLEFSCKAGGKTTVMWKGQEVGRAYHRLNDPNNGKNHIDLFLDKNAPPGTWQITLHGVQVKDGRYNAWLEREGKTRQARFEKEFAVTQTTNGTICNGYNSVVVGSVSPQKKPSVFSSSGPTTDGRNKPDIVAFGEKVLGPRAAPPGANTVHAALKRDTGTSFSTPQVTGTVALMLEAATIPVDAATMRTLLLSAAAPIAGLTETESLRIGNGLLQTGPAVQAMRQYQQQLSTELKHQKMMQFQDFETASEQLFPSRGPSAGDIHLTPNSGPRSLPLATGAPQVFPDLDAALRTALRPGGPGCIIRGQMFSGGNFTLQELNLPICPVTPLIVRFLPAFPDVCCLVLEGFAPYFPSNVPQPPNRWEQYPDLRSFYGQSQATQTAQRNLWINKLVSTTNQVNPILNFGGVVPTAQQVRQFSAPELRWILATFAETLFTVRDVDNTDTRGRRWIGAGMNGVTMVNLPVPLSEPDCYLKVISDREGKLEAINAYDGGAGISIGTVQFNAQNKALHKLLWKVWQQDNELFQIAFSTLGWTMNSAANGEITLTVTPTDGSAPFTITSIQRDRFVNYLHSGNPTSNTRTIPFRRLLTQRFRLLVTRPHIQSLINEVSSEVYTEPGLRLLHQNGIPQLNIAAPSRELFQLKSALLSAYIRATGCAGNLIRALNRYPSTAQKLAHLDQEINNLRPIGSFNCAEAFRLRLPAQVREAGQVFQQIQPVVPPQAAPTAPQAPSQTAPVQAPPATDWYAGGSEHEYVDSENTLWKAWEENYGYS